MLSLRPRQPLSFKQKAWAMAQHALLRNDWPTTLLVGLGLAPGLSVLETSVTSEVSLGSARRLRIAFASDFHAGPTTHRSQIERAFSAIVASAPDVILLGGDFVGHRPVDMLRLAAGLMSLQAPLGCFAVLGNHDNHTDPTLVAEVLGESGVRLLVNEAVRLPPPFEQTQLIGLDDHTTGAPDATQITAAPELTTIVLLHQPSGVLDVSGHRFDLALAGHTHGGQIVLPGGYAPVTPSGALSRRYLAGRYPLDHGGVLLVSRGVGASTVPVRWNAPPDMMLVTLSGATAGKSP